MDTAETTCRPKYRVEIARKPYARLECTTCLADQVAKAIAVYTNTGAQTRAMIAESILVNDVAMIETSGYYAMLSECDAVPFIHAYVSAAQVV